MINDEFETTDLQKMAWRSEIQILKEQLFEFSHGDIIFEYTIPRMGHRVDVICIIEGIIFLLEFKVGDKEYKKSTTDQVMDYALDLKYFHDKSRTRYLVPINVSTKAVEIQNEYYCIKPIDEAARLLRSAERNVTAPTAENNPFEYLKMMCPEFIPAFDQIIDFWNDFSDSEIRRRYNFCKHKGRPAYQEIEELSSGRVMGFYVQNKDTGEKIQMASDISDVRYSFSLEDAIVQLVDFDDNKLFPYIRKLIDTLEDILEPSPMI